MSPATAEADDYCVGRDEELGRLAILSDVGADRPVIVTGPWGSGKSTLLRALAARARASGVHVIHASPARPLASGPGTAPAALAPYADLQALLGQLAPLTRRPGPAESAARRSPLAAGVAAVRLLASAAEASAAGVLALVDDAHELDTDSARALAVICRRLRSVRAGVVLASGERTLPAGLDVPAEELALGPLADHDAHRLLERRTTLRRGRLRRTVVAQAEGNPLALLDFARAVTLGPLGERTLWPGSRPLPCSPATMRRLSPVIGRLPALARLALLIAAATTGDELGEVIAADPRGLTPGTWRAAEDAGLVVTSARGVEFTHPLIRSVIYHSARADELALVHRGIAEGLAGRPERRTWHLAEALAPGARDPGLAARLERGAGDTARRRGPEAAATALERAAELATADEDTARLLAGAAAQASLTGDTTWAQELAARAGALTRDPRMRDRATVLAGSSLVWAGAYERALPLLLPLARSRPPADPEFTRAALCAAALAAYCLGESRYRGEVAATVSLLAGETAGEQDAALLFSLAAGNPGGDRQATASGVRELVSATARSADRDTAGGADPRLTGMAAWLLDESELAVGALGRSLDGLAGWTGRGRSGGVTAALAWACLDTGRWSRAGDLAGRVLATEMVDEAESSIVAAQTILAFLAAHYGDPAAAARLAATAGDQAQSWSDRAALARARHAAGLGALNDGQPDTAYELLGELLSDHGQGPLHFHCSYYAVADFALAAVNAGRRTSGSRVLASALRRLEGVPSPRIGLLIAHARGLLSAGDDAERHFQSALGPGSGQWPVEQARATLHYAQWLRRRHRERAAVPLLVSARRSFELVNARPEITRVNAELRAARQAQAVPERAAIASAWAQLPARQRHILRLAAQGMSNQEIAAELTLSPRTVGSHLYRAFPALGVSSRHQLRDVLAGLDD